MKRFGEKAVAARHPPCLTTRRFLSFPCPPGVTVLMLENCFKISLKL
jgi:hypothetical protein